MNIPVNEQETIITFSRDSDFAEIYTSDTTMRTKLHKLNSKNSKDWVLVKQDRDRVDHDIVSEIFRCPKRLISLRRVVATRAYTEEQRQAAAERLKKARQSKS
ncbi:MAG: hypothetical protein ACI4ET_04845 [Bilifractor sp.]